MKKIALVATLTRLHYEYMIGYTLLNIQDSNKSLNSTKF